jgi:phosphatidate cytidylyltransferase
MAVSWLLLLLFGSFQLFWIIIVVGAGIALYEYFRMTEKELVGSSFWLPLVIASFPVIASYFGTTEAVMTGLICSLLALVFLVLRLYSRLDDILLFLSLGGLGTLYIGLCSAHLVLLYALENGVYWLIILTAMTAGSDTGAYYAGRAFGNKKLCPSISPGKTVAGGIGGILAGIITAELVSMILPITASLIEIVIIALALVPIGISGDLIESVIKRASDVKDSGSILGGHGGLLDRIDSLLLTAPVLYYLLYYGVLQ